MSFFKGKYLRVLVPVTVDGINLAYENGKPKFKEVHMPETALKVMTKKNERLPNQLKRIIEVVDNVIPQRPLPPTGDENNVTISKEQLEKLLARVKESEDKLAQQEAVSKPKGPQRPAPKAEAPAPQPKAENETAQ